MALGAVTSIAVPLITGTQWQSQAARDAGRCAHAKTLFERVMGGDTGTATDWQGNNPRPIIEQINYQRTNSATAAGRACYEQVWQALADAGKLPSIGAGAGAQPEAPPAALRSVASVGAARASMVPFWVWAVAAGVAGWYFIKKKG